MSPDVVDSGQALEAAEALESTWDPDPILQEAEQAKLKGWLVDLWDLSKAIKISSLQFLFYNEVNVISELITNNPHINCLSSVHDILHLFRVLCHQGTGFASVQCVVCIY